MFNRKYCNVGMTQQWSLAKKDKKSDVERPRQEIKME